MSSLRGACRCGKGGRERKSGPAAVMHRSSGQLSRVALLVALLLLCGLAAGVPQAAQSQEAVTVRGKLVNGTEGHSIPEGLAVLMLVTGPDGTLAGTGQTLAGPDGRFSFEDVATVPDGVYTLSVDYGGVFYGVTVSVSDLAEEKTIEIYEPTEDAGIIVVDRQVMVVSGIDVSQREATATEFVRFTNPTDRTLQANLETARPGMFSFMRFALPPDAANVTVQSNLRGGEVISVGTGFALTAPVPPGEHSVDFAYTFPIEDGRVTYRNSLPQGAGVFQILVPSRWESVQVGGLDARQPVGIEDEVYRAWEVRDVPPGPGVTIVIDGLPQPGVLARVGSTLGGDTFWLTAIPGAVGAGLLALLVLGMVRRFRPETAGVAAAGMGEVQQGVAPTMDREALVLRMAELDELFEDRGIEEEAYFRQRAELVARALGQFEENES